MCHLSPTNKSAMLGTIYAEPPATLCEAILFCRGFSPLSQTLTYAYVHIPTDKEPSHQSVTPSTGISWLIAQSFLQVQTCSRVPVLQYELGYYSCL